MTDDRDRCDGESGPDGILCWHRLALGAVLFLAAFLDFFRLGADGDGNLYYAAAVKSMLASWHNFFFVSFDPGGFVTVDKPPVNLWFQTGSAALFGLRGFSLFFPQALTGLLSVALLYHLVQRAYGRLAGLLAALALAVTPISVATNRNNTMDSLLVFVFMLATWAVTRATESGRLRWLVLGGVLVGLGFEVKMLEAFLVLPTLTLLYLAAAPIILDTGKPVMALGGFMGSDPILSADQLARLVTGGVVRYFLLQSPAFQQADLQQWVSAHCSVVPSPEWQSAPVSGVAAPPNRGFGGFGRGGAEQLYDCTNAATPGQSTANRREKSLQQIPTVLGNRGSFTLQGRQWL